MLDIIREIVSSLKIPDILSTSRVSRIWYTAVTSTKYYKDMTYGELFLAMGLIAANEVPRRGRAHKTQGIEVGEIYMILHRHYCASFMTRDMILGETDYNCYRLINGMIDGKDIGYMEKHYEYMERLDPKSRGRTFAVQFGNMAILILTEKFYIYFDGAYREYENKYDFFRFRIGEYVAAVSNYYIFRDGTVIRILSHTAYEVYIVDRTGIFKYAKKEDKTLPCMCDTMCKEQEEKGVGLFSLLSEPTWMCKTFTKLIKNDYVS